jgi:molybdopterin synthase catalytic subunit
LFAAAAEIAGTRTVLLPAEGGLTIHEAFSRLCRMFPEFRKLDGRLLFAANAEYAGPEFVLHGGDELALITPVSGGSDSGAG